jgi:hypothetical protein
MNIYWVTGQDPYVEIDGSVQPPNRFGPWAQIRDAEKAGKALGDQKQMGYGGAGEMPAYEDIQVCTTELLTDFQVCQVY